MTSFALIERSVRRKCAVEQSDADEEGRERVDGKPGRKENANAARVDYDCVVIRLPQGQDHCTNKVR